MRRPSPMLVTSIALLLALPGCGSSAASSTADQGSDDTYTSGDQPSEFDEDAARADAEQEVADEGYSGPCTNDCSGHNAGFNWAAEGHEDYGTSDSQSFDEGQQAYQEAVDERVEEKRQQFEDGQSGSDSDDQ